MSYGLEIFDTDGTTAVVTPDIRFGCVIASATNVTLDSTTTFIDFVMDMTGISASTVSIVEISDTWSNTGAYSDRYNFNSDRIRIACYCKSSVAAQISTIKKNIAISVSTLKSISVSCVRN